jgi:hypothetical protein
VKKWVLGFQGKPRPGFSSSVMHARPSDANRRPSWLRAITGPAGERDRRPRPRLQPGHGACAAGGVATGRNQNLGRLHGPKSESS